MFGNEFESRRPFSVTLAVKLLEYELQKIYGPEVCILYSTAISTARVGTDRKMSSFTKFEEEHWSSGQKYVAVEAVIGPFERLYPNNPPEDKRRRLRKARAICRLFTLESNCKGWQPHFLLFTVTDDEQKDLLERECYYESGTVRPPRSSEFVVPLPTQAKNAEHPFASLISSQSMLSFVRPEDPEPTGKSKRKLFGKLSDWL